jgi:hypothetical protein
MHKNKVQKSGKFVAPAQMQFSHHIHHAIHHVLTIKKPPSTTHFFQNTPQKPSKTTKTPETSRAKFFSENCTYREAV